MVKSSWRKPRLIVQLGIGQTIGYASSYYLPAVLASRVVDDLGLSYTGFYALFTAATLLGIVLGPMIGRSVDRTTVHFALPASSLLFAAGLLVMAVAPNYWVFVAGWLVLSLGGALGLYEVAFATVVRLESDNPRQVIAGITLIAGFASTIGWPLTALISDVTDWRWALVFWAVVQLAINLPLYVFLPGVSRWRGTRLKTPRRPKPVWSVKVDVTLVLFGLMLGAGGFIQGAMGLHLIPVLEAGQVSPDQALWAATLLGPGQVLARLLQLVIPQIFGPRLISILSLVLHGIAVAMLFVFGPGFAPVFAFIHGMGSGFYTVAVGTLPLELYGSKNYGERQGFILAISRAIMVITPFGFSLAVSSLGAGALILTASASGVGLLLLGLLLTRFRLIGQPTHEIRDVDPVTIESGPIDIPDDKDLK